jgi:hypothetical protein
VDDETTAVSTVVNEPNLGEKDGTDAMLEEQLGAIEEIRTEPEENDTTMTDKDHNTPSQQQQEQQETPTNRITAVIAEGDYSHQFSNKPKNIDKINNSTPTGVNHQ